MKIKVNGKEQTIAKDKISVSTLLEINKIERPEMVSVQLNGEFVNKEKYNSTYLKESDEVDFLYFMGGGDPSPVIARTSSKARGTKQSQDRLGINSTI